MAQGKRSSFIAAIAALWLMLGCSGNGVSLQDGDGPPGSIDKETGPPSLMTESEEARIREAMAKAEADRYRLMELEAKNGQDAGATTPASSATEEEVTPMETASAESMGDAAASAPSATEEEVVEPTPTATASAATMEPEPPAPPSTTAEMVESTPMETASAVPTEPEPPTPPSEEKLAEIQAALVAAMENPPPVPVTVEEYNAQCLPEAEDICTYYNAVGAIDSSAMGDCCIIFSTHFIECGEGSLKSIGTEGISPEVGFCTMVNLVEAYMTEGTLGNQPFCVLSATADLQVSNGATDQRCSE